jgi:hypothetical protein
VHGVGIDIDVGTGSSWKGGDLDDLDLSDGEESDADPAVEDKNSRIVSDIEMCLRDLFEVADLTFFTPSDLSSLADSICSLKWFCSELDLSDSLCQLFDICCGLVESDQNGSMDAVVRLLESIPNEQFHMWFSHRIASERLMLTCHISDLFVDGLRSSNSLDFNFNWQDASVWHAWSLHFIGIFIFTGPVAAGNRFVSVDFDRDLNMLKRNVKWYNLLFIVSVSYCYF